MITNEQIFVGRENELKILQNCLNGIFNNTLQICLVSGGPGDGKTTLVEYFAEIAKEENQNLDYIIGNCDIITGKHDMYEPFRDIFAQLIGIRARNIESYMTPEREYDTRNKIQLVAEILKKVAPDLIGTIIPIAGLISKAVFSATDQIIKRRIIVSNSEDVKIKHNEICNQSVNFFRQRSQNENPLILIFDDIQWIDDSSLKLLIYLIKNLQDVAIMIILTYRDELTPGPRNLIDYVKRNYDPQQIDLRKAKDESGREFVKQFLKGNNCEFEDEKFLEAFLDLTGATPIFSVELLHFLKSRGVLTMTPFGIWKEAMGVTDWQPSLSTRFKDDIDPLIEERLSQLSEVMLEILRVASVQGYEFAAQVVALVTGLDERSVLRMLSSELGKKYDLVREITEEVIGENIVSYFRFTNVLYQKHIYDRLGTGEKRFLHKKVAEAINHLYCADTSSVAVQLARQYELGKDLVKATNHLIYVGESLVKTANYDEALSIYHKALTLAREANYSSGIVDALRFIAVNVKLNKDTKKDIEEAKPLLEESRTLAESEGMLKELCYILRGMGRVYRKERDDTLAMYYYMESLHIAKQLGSKNDIGACYNNIGTLAAYKMRFEDACFYYEKRYQIAKDMDDEVGKVKVLMNWSTALHGLADQKPEHKNKYLLDAHKMLKDAEAENKLQRNPDRAIGIMIIKARIYTKEGELGQAMVELRDSIQELNGKDLGGRRREVLEALVHLMAAKGSRDYLLPEIIGYLEPKLNTERSQQEIHDLTNRVRNRWDDNSFVEAKERGAQTDDKELDKKLIKRGLEYLDSNIRIGSTTTNRD